MGWEQRGSRSYYYRKIRRGRKVNSEYIGSGEVAALIAGLDEIARNKQKAVKVEWRKRKEAIYIADFEASEASTLIQSIVRAHLLIAGYHPHKGQFRRRRNGE